MKLSVFFDDCSKEIEVDDSHLCRVIQPKSPGAIDETATVRHALEFPLGAASLADYVKDRQRVLLVVNDGTRPTPTRLVLDTLWPVLKDKSVRVLVATGTHRAPTESEYRNMFGGLWDVLRDRVDVHDARTSSSFLLGKTRYGNAIRLNAALQEADAIIPIGSIEPHYFAGYTGGRKSFMPGLAAYDCIEANHKLAISPAAAAASLEGNPVAEELQDVALLLIRDFPVFAVMTVLDRHHRIVAASCGDLIESFRLLTRKADEIYLETIEQRADIVVSVAYAPTDLDFYQAHKAIEHGKYALRDGGILILVAACREGIGPGAFMDLLLSEGEPDQIVKKMTSGYRLGYHKALKIVNLFEKAQIWAVTTLEPDLLRRVRIRPFHDVSEAVSQALNAMGPDARILFLMDAGHMVPKCKTDCD